tara:strand:- start:32930 stop:33127 length:198 start_codon:yes stop_codon:yes gene_type:complete
MDIKVILEIAENASKRSNKDLIEAATILSKEFEDTKSLMVQLSHHLDNVENSYYQISEEIKGRKG